MIVTHRTARIATEEHGSGTAYDAIAEFVASV